MGKNKEPKLYQRLLGGDETAVAEFRAVLQNNPDLVESFAQKPLEVLLARIAVAAEGVKAGSPLMFRESLLAKMNALRTELSGPDPTAIERLLVERVVACWLAVFHADLAAVMRGPCLMAESVFDLKRQAAASRRFLSACKTLANVRRLALPLQVDVSLAAVAAIKVETKNTVPLERLG